ncbi:MAG: twin-arginine translocation signal domain-containing protein, partial [Deltaproteobacteria bacterium]|nr:twin-arginine translocation signal domain-containing protein [Deltaproteobacteria bacterium]
MKPKVRTRREFLKETTTAALAGALYLSTPVELFAKTQKKTRVVLVRNKDVLDNLNKSREEVVQQMLDEAVTTLLDEKDPVQAWKKLIKPTDIVGIKSNEWQPICTPPELERAIESRILDAGVSVKNIGINDRGVRHDPLFLKATALINVRPLRTHHWSGVGSLIKNYIIFLEEPYTYHPDTCADLASIWKLPLL